jgi:hypothetical protein
VRDFIETDEPPLRYTYDGEDEDDEPEQAPPIIVPVAALPPEEPQTAGSPGNGRQLHPHGDELPAPPFRPGQTHFLFTRAGQDLIDNGMRDGIYVGMVAHKTAQRFGPLPHERHTHREMFPELETYFWSPDEEEAP